MIYNRFVKKQNGNTKDSENKNAKGKKEMKRTGYRYVIEEEKCIRKNRICDVSVPIS